MQVQCLEFISKLFICNTSILSWIGLEHTCITKRAQNINRHWTQYFIKLYKTFIKYVVHTILT